MIKNVLISSILVMSCALRAQEVISTQGDSFSNANGSLDFTIGEVVINTGTDGSNDITQGFHQTNWNFLELPDYAPDYEVSIFPNPTEDILNIVTSTFENVTYILYNSQGKVIFKEKLLAETTTIPFSQLALGNYSLTLLKDEKVLKSFQIININN